MIVKTHGGDQKLRSLDGLVAMELQAGGGRLTSSLSVTQKEAFGLPAATAAIRVASWAVAKRSLRVWRGEETERQQVTSTWQARFFSGQPNGRQSWFDVLEATEASLTSRNNAYWLKFMEKGSGRVSEAYVIHPDCVDARWNDDKGQPEYKLRSPDSQKWTDWLDESYVTHFSVGFPSPGAIIQPTPFQVHKEAFGGAVGKLRYETTVYSEGLLNKVAVTFPKEVNREQAEEYRDLIVDSHGGIDKAGGVLVLGAGATAAQIGLSLADAEYVESKMFSAREMGQILGVPATLIDANTRDQRPMSPEHEEDRWNRHWLEPRLVRIQSRLNIDPAFFGPGARAYVAFGDTVVRGDVAAESNRLVTEVQAGILTSNEARAEKGLKPLAGGDVLQVTPVGGKPNPNLPASDAPADDTEDSQL